MTVVPSSDARSDILRQFQRLVGEDSVSPWEALELPLRLQLERAIAPHSSTEPPLQCLVSPRTQEELAEVVACSYHHQWNVLPIGNGSKLHWGGLIQAAPLIGICTAKLNRLIEHAVGDLTVTAEAGIRLADLIPVLTHERQQLGLDPAFPDAATLGGVVATANTGSSRQRYGSVRDMLIGLSFVRADGQMAKAGGRVVKNVAGYDLMKLMTGSYGTLGIISQLTLRVYPVAEASQSLLLTGSAGAIAQLTATLMASALTPTRLDLVSPGVIESLRHPSTPSSKTRSPDQAGHRSEVGLVVQFQSIAVSVEEQVAYLSRMSDGLPIQSTAYSDADEGALWQQLRDLMTTAPSERTVTCKIGVWPNQAIATLEQLPKQLPVEALAQIHVASGIGTLRFDGEAIAPQSILRLRAWCEARGGYLTLLEAPVSWKQQVEVWGYPGNALALMKRLKHQFDPQHQLSPHRFLGGL